MKLKGLSYKTAYRTVCYYNAKDESTVMYEEDVYRYDDYKISVDTCYRLVHNEYTEEVESLGELITILQEYYNKQNGNNLDDFGYRMYWDQRRVEYYGTEVQLVYTDFCDNKQIIYKLMDENGNILKKSVFKDDIKEFEFE